MSKYGALLLSLGLMANLQGCMAPEECSEADHTAINVCNLETLEKLMAQIEIDPVAKTVDEKNGRETFDLCVLMQANLDCVSAQNKVCCDYVITEEDAAA